MDAELRDAMARQAVAMNNVAKSMWLNYMATQKSMENRTPSSVLFGTALIDTSSIEWVQILQRNRRRAYVELIFRGDYLMINNSNTTDALELAKNFARSAGTLDLLLGDTAIYGSSSNPIKIETTSPLYVAAFNVVDAAPTTVQGFITWQEAIYSDVSAIPLTEQDLRSNKPGTVQKSTQGLMHPDEDVRATYSHDGVR